MNMTEGMSRAIEYIESSLTEEIRIEDVAARAYMSQFYFRKAFGLLCGITVGEYIRGRRLTLAGSEIVSSDIRIIDVALKYGYDSPDSFTRAFVKFHGVAPSSVRRDGAMLKAIAPLRISLTLKGGSIMDYKIMKKEAFTVVGSSRRFDYENSYVEIPKFWDEHFSSGRGKTVCGMYGICFSGSEGDESFDYIIADDYKPWKETPEGFEVRTIPKLTWAVFPCIGPEPKTLQETNTRIFSEWLPGCTDYELSERIGIEMYSNAEDYPKGTEDPNYYCEIWVPVKKKEQ